MSARRGRWRALGLAAVFSALALPAAAADPAAGAARSAPGAAAPAELKALVARVLARSPVIDGHNDLPWELRQRFASRLSQIDLSNSLQDAPRRADEAPLMTDVPRLRAGGVGGQFWSVWVPASITGPRAVEMTLEQIDLVKEMVRRRPETFALAESASDVRAAERAGKIACLIGIEGGHQIDGSAAVLRQMFALGARYMTLTHVRNTSWADSATDAPEHHGLTPFGVAMVREMNRIGMLVDLSHVSPETMNAVLDVTRAPVMFSHSSARALVDHPRDVPDDVLLRVKANGGVVMVNFAPSYVSEARRRWSAERGAEETRENAPPYGGLYIGQPERAKAALAAWDAAHPKPEVVLSDVADHIDHIRAVAGVESVGLGSDFDGIPETPEGLEGVDRFPALLMELARRGWSAEDLEKLTGGNILRVLAKAQEVAGRLRSEEALETPTARVADE